MWVVFSVVSSPWSTQALDAFAFETAEAAEAYADKMEEDNPDFTYFVAEGERGHKWLAASVMHTGFEPQLQEWSTSRTKKEARAWIDEQEEEESESFEDEYLVYKISLKRPA